MIPALRYQVLTRDGYSCQQCGTSKILTSHLQIHHIKPRELGGPDSLDNLITLCGSCHRKVEDGNRIHAFLEHREILDPINAMAACEGVTQSEIVRRALRLYLSVTQSVAPIN